MKQSRLLFTLLQPSVFSLICTGLFALATLLASSWSFLKTQSFFTNYFSGDYGLHTLVTDVNSTIGRTINAIVSYNIIVICMAVLVGLIVFAILQSVHHMHKEVSDTIDDLKYADDKTKISLEKGLELRIGLRGVTALAWLGYSLFFFNILVPLCATLVTKHASQPLGGPISNLIAFAILLVMTHFHVIFARLLVLRPRLFGVDDLVGRGGH